MSVAHPGDSNEIRKERISPDIRSIPQRIKLLLDSPRNISLLLIGAALFAYAFPAQSDLALPFGAFVFWFGMRQRIVGPVKLPIQSDLWDPNEGEGVGRHKAAGIFYLGNEIRSGKEIWFSNSDCRQHFLVIGTTGAGKALADDTLVHTPAGWRRMGDLKPGDGVSTPDGGIARIDGVFPQGMREIWRLHFADGRTADACPDHLWPLLGGDTAPADGPVARTAELAGLLQQGLRPTLPLPAALEQPEAVVPIDPYLLGGRLAAGSARTIPPAYLAGSIAQRRALVRGLIDAGACRTDGSDLTLAVAEADTAREWQQILWSLGAWAALETSDGTVCRLRIRHPAGLLGGDAPRPATVGLELIRIEPAVRRAHATCIHVDHPTHRFVAENFVPTHNTEMLLGFASNALAWGSGLLFVDGKGDIGLYARLSVLARRFGREDDMLFINFNTGNSDVAFSDGPITQISNSTNPFASGASDSLISLVVGLMDDAGGENAIWKSRAEAMFGGLMRALTYLRDRRVIRLDVDTIRQFLSLQRIYDLSRPELYDLPDSIRRDLYYYLRSLAGWKDDVAITAQSAQVFEQHGFLEMQYTKIMQSLGTTYAHIFGTQAAEVDMEDVVLRRRILVVMLPALEKPSTEIYNLGKIIVGTLKGMMGGMLAARLDGSLDHLLEARPTNAKTPFLCILDEVGYYTVDGLALIAAQARSLGFAMCYATQDMPSMLRHNEKEAASIKGNTSVHIFMRTNEGKTIREIIDEGGKTFVARVGEMDRGTGDMSIGYRRSGTVRVQEVDQFNARDLAGQRAGMMMVSYEGRKIVARSFFPNPKDLVDSVKITLRPCQFIALGEPTRDEVQGRSLVPKLIARVLGTGFAQEMAAAVEARLATVAVPDTPDDLAFVRRVIGQIGNAPRKSIEATCIALAGVAQRASRQANGLTAERKRAVPLREPWRRQPAPAPENPGPVDFGDGEPAVRPSSVADEAPAGASVSPVRHGIHIDGGALIPLGTDVAANETILRALAALDTDGNATTEDLDRKLEWALAPNAAEDAPTPGAQAELAAAFRALAEVMPEAAAPSGPGKTEPPTSVDFLLGIMEQQDKPET